MGQLVSTPGLATSDDECVSVPDVDFESDSSNDDLESLAKRIIEGREEGEGGDGTVGDADNLNFEPV